MDYMYTMTGIEKTMHTIHSMSDEKFEEFLVGLSGTSTKEEMVTVANEVITFMKLADTDITGGLDSIKDILRKGDYIQAIKMYRDKYGTSLRRARDECQRLRIQMGIQ